MLAGRQLPSVNAPRNRRPSHFEIPAGYRAPVSAFLVGLVPATPPRSFLCVFRPQADGDRDGRQPPYDGADGKNRREESPGTECAGHVGAVG